MNLSKKGEYALRALMNLAKKHDGGVTRIRDIAEQASVPQPFLEQILLQLKNARIVESVKGAEGGYRLRRPPDEITVGEVIRIVDGALAPFNDVQTLRKQIKEEEDFVGLYSIILDVRNAISDILDNTTLADLGERTRKMQLQKEKAASQESS